MIAFFEGVSETLSNVFGFFQNVFDTFVGFGKSVSGFFSGIAGFIAVLPVGTQTVIWVGLGLLVAFIVIELLRDFL